MNTSKQDPNMLTTRGCRWGRRFTFARETRALSLPGDRAARQWIWTVASSADGSMDRMVRRACCLTVADGRDPYPDWRRDVAHMLRKMRAANRKDVARL